MKSILKTTIQGCGEKKALIFKDQQITFSELRDHVLKAANLLKSIGVEKGDKVGIYLPNCPEYIYTYLAIFELGAVGVPLDFMLKSDELVSCLTHSDAKVLIGMPRRGFLFKELQERVPTLKNYLDCTLDDSGQSDFKNKLWQQSVTEIDVDILESDPALIIYTSGTTGKPKGIQLNYKHLNGSPLAMDHFVDLSENDVKLCAIPFSHIGGFIYIQNIVKFGITLILMDRFNPFEFLNLVKEFKVTCFHIVPPMYNAILTLKQIDQFDLSSLRWVVVFGAPNSPEIMERFHKYCPNAKLLNGWGMTETCPPNTVTPMDSDNIASIGKPSPQCEIQIVDENDEKLKVDEIGEIIIRGEYIMDSYFKDAEATAKVLKNGWLHTGDLGKFDAEGFLYIVGRKKEMVKVAGQIVYEPEVEASLYKHEDIVEVAVVGIPDQLKGEAVKAFVVLKEGSSLTEEDIRYFARQHLANFKVPQQIDIRQELPKNRTGKIDKNILKEQIVNVN